MMGLHNYEILAHQLRKPGILKAIAPLLVSVCLFHYIVSHSSCSSFILHSLNSYLSEIPLQSLGKRWMFLICTGIFLVILVGSPSTGYDHPHKPAAEEDVRVFLTESSAELDGSAVFSAQNEKNDQESSYEEVHEVQKGSHVDHQCCNEEEQEDHSLITIAEDDEDQSEQAGYELLKIEGGAEAAEEIKICIIEDNEDDESENENHPDEAGSDNLLEEEEEGEEESGILEKMSAEELNKKFEDFIRKMKEELRIEAQQHHLVAVK